jgi:hypothetical protein
MGSLYSRAGAAIDGEKRKESSRLMRIEHIDLKHGECVRPNRFIPELIDAQLGKLPSDPLVQLAGVPYIVISVVD